MTAGVCCFTFLPSPFSFLSDFKRSRQARCGWITAVQISKPSDNFVLFQGDQAQPGMMHFRLILNSDLLKAVDTIGNCQRLAFAVGVSQHMHKITNLCKFELNRSSKLRDNNERRNHPCHTKLCAFRLLILRPQVLNLRSRNQIHGKLLQSFSKTMALHGNLSPLLVPKKGFMLINILSKCQLCPLPLKSAWNKRCCIFPQNKWDRLFNLLLYFWGYFSRGLSLGLAMLVSQPVHRFDIFAQQKTVHRLYLLVTLCPSLLSA